MSQHEKTISRLREMDTEVTRLGHIASLLEWDQETYLPERAVEGRAAQIALLTGIRYEKLADKEWGELFDRLGCDDAGDSAQLDEEHRPLVRETCRRWIKTTKVSRRLMEETARTVSLSQAAWAAARAEDDFPAFLPHLERVLALRKEYAQAVSAGPDDYDTLLDEYEPGASGRSIAAVFDDLARGLKTILDKITAAPPPDVTFLNKNYPRTAQNQFGERIQRCIGFDGKRGRIDLSAHPFTTTLGPHDIRLTTRYSENNVLSGIFSNMHEAGHGLYEQGVAESLYDSILGDGASLGIHESQSRFWENIVGRSRAFWERWLEDFRTLFPENLSGIGLDQFHRAVNMVSPSLIRVEADEVTYAFHVIIRFRLERAMVLGDLAVADLPDAWREAYEDLLSIRPLSDAEGCMQDIHWSGGLFGYFPTYALGNLYAAQFTQAMERDLGPLDALIRSDEASRVLEWLRRSIHVHGKSLKPDEICRRVTGGPLKVEPFLKYLRGKYGELYRF